MTPVSNSKVVMKNKTYDRIKWAYTIGLPAVGAFYFALAQIFDFSRITGVNGTINAVIALIGAFMGWSSREYAKTVGAPDGELMVNEVDGETSLALGLKDKTVEELAAKDSVTLAVVDNTLQPPL